jgi:lysophospholipase L1-like esterase
MRNAPRALRAFRGIAASLALLGCYAAIAAEPANVERCLAVAADMKLDAPLPKTRTKLHAGQPVTIVALGSSSTTGVGTLGPGFPAVMKAELARRHPADIAVINSGRIFETAGGNLARFEKDVLRFQPDLVIWQLGTNDVMWRGGARSAETPIRDGVRRLKQAGVEVILMDLQDAPAVRGKPSHVGMENLIAEVSREEAVGLFPRFLLMQRAHAQGVKGLVAWDGLHNSAAGYRCIGLALARMIDADAAR